VGKLKGETVYTILPNVLHRIEVSVMWQQHGLTDGNTGHQDKNSNPLFPLLTEKRSSGVSRKEYIADYHADQSFMS
jgi:hypothetical protein